MISRISELRREYGRDQLPFEIHVISMDGFSREGIERLEKLGVTDVIVGFRNLYTTEADTQTLEQKIEALERFAEQIIQKAEGA